MAKPRKSPWNKQNPKKKTGKPTKHLSPAQKAGAKRAAKKAGRKYPSLVDNMNAAKKAKKKKPARKSAARKTSGKSSVARKK